MSSSKLTRMKPQIRQVMQLQPVPNFDPQEFDPKADTLDQCELVGCLGVVLYQDAPYTSQEPGSCQYTFFKHRLASFSCYIRETEAVDIHRTWPTMYGQSTPDVEWQKEFKLLSGKANARVIGDIWKDSSTRATLDGGLTDQNPFITFEDLVADKKMRAEAAQIAAAGPQPAQSGETPGPFCDQMAAVVKSVAEMRDKGVDEEIAMSSYRIAIKTFAGGKGR